jgi:hypothetical protein
MVFSFPLLFKINKKEKENEREREGGWKEGRN